MSTAPNIIDRAKKIKLLILDVDGVLTHGDLLYTDQGDVLKSFNVQDGLGIRMLQKSGIEMAIITGNQSASVAHRAKALGIQYLYQGKLEKLPCLDELLTQLKLKADQVAYVGDDLIDLPLLTRVGLAVAVANAHDMIKPHVHLQTSRCGGNAAVREVCDLILAAQGKLKAIEQSFLDQGQYLSDQAPC